MTGKFSRRGMLASLLAGLVAAPALAAVAEDFPRKPVTIVAVAAPGSVVDILARLLADGMSEAWGQQVIVKNVAGAGGSIGAGQVADADADGYTLGFVSANLTTLPYLYDIGFDVRGSFAPVIRVAGAPMVHYVATDLGIATEQDFIAHAKANPGKLTFATAGTASAANLAAELFQHKTGTRMTAVPYDKLNMGVLDVMSGRVSTVFVSAAQGMQFVRDGKLVALGVTSLEGATPELRPISEQGAPGYDFSSWFGFIVPSGTPADVVEKLRGEVLRQAETPAFQDALSRSGLVPILDTPEQFGTAIDAELENWSGLLKR